MPKERFGSASAIHKRFLEWEEAGFFEALWKAGLAEYDALEGGAWRWQSIDGAMMKAPMAQATVGRNPMGRGKNGSKRHLLVDGRGVPLSLVVTGTNRHDVSQLESVLDAIVIKRSPRPSAEANICALTQAMPERLRWRSLSNTNTSRTSKGVGKNRLN